MALRHTKRVWELPLPTTERFVLMSLADHASDKEICWPSNDRIAEHTGLCVKSVGRAIKRLQRLGIISIDKSKRYNTYTLHINGDLDYLQGYIKFHTPANKASMSENQGCKKDSESDKPFNITKLENGVDFKEVIEDSGEAKYSLKPSESKAPYQDLWLSTIKKTYNGWDFPLNDNDKWNLNDIYKKLKGLPGEIIVTATIKYWKGFVKQVKEDNQKIKYKNLDLDIPSTKCFLDNIDTAKSFALMICDMSDTLQDDT